MPDRRPWLVPFDLAIAIRVVALAGTLAIAAWLTVRPGYVATTAILVAAAVAQTVALVRAIGRSHAELSSFLTALAAGEPGAARPRRGAGRLVRLERAFDEVNARFQARLHEVTRDSHYHAAVNASVPIPLLAIDGDRVTLVNAAARRLVDGRATTLADLDRLGVDLRRDLATLPAGQRRITKIQTEGTTRSCLIDVSEVAIAGRVTRLVALQDIQGELDAAAFRAWDRMVRVLAHEIMGSITPVASLTSSAAELVATASDEVGAAPAADLLVEARDALTTATRRCETLMDFVARYRQFSALPRPQRAPVALDALFASVRELFAGERRGADLAIDVTVEPHHLEVSADRALLEQAVINLVRNAIDAVGGRPGARVTVHARLARDGRAVIEVADNGPGIADAVADQLFTPFFTTKRGGSGIGLSLVQQIALAHGGAAWCRNRAEGGAVFAMTI